MANFGYALDDRHTLLRMMQLNPLKPVNVVGFVDIVSSLNSLLCDSSRGFISPSFYIFSALVIAAFAFLFSWLLLFFLVPIFRVYFLDYPSNRSSHFHPTPRGGGIVFIVVAIAACLILSLCSLPGNPSNISMLPLYLLPLGLVGIFDDLRGIRIIYRLCIQSITVVFMLAVLPVKIESVSFYSLFPFLFIFGVAMINLFNFCDGLDGLLASCILVALPSVLISLNAPLSIWGIPGALLGFLFWNWSPARIFMGDSGSTFLGALYFGLVLKSNSVINGLSYALIITPLLGDSLSCLFRRYFSGVNVCRPHKSHLYQRLHQAGMPHFAVAAIYAMGTFIGALSFSLGGFPFVLFVSGIEIVIGIYLDNFIASPYSGPCEG